MLKIYVYFVFLYIGCYEIIFNGVVPILLAIFEGYDSDSTNPYPGMRENAIELVGVAFLMFGVCRPRKWPAWFHINLVE
jgi:hypothetical protein